MNAKSKYCLEVCKSRCCKKLFLSRSPKNLKEAYLEWVNKTSEKTVKDIWLLYPMLEFIKKKRGKVARPYEYRCKFLIKGKCSIYEIRPTMCSGFGTTYEADAGDKCIYSKTFKK
jgi:Fe-S-cluster containining protein